ncbi:hypothetical protein [Allopontixanthobacter sp.]|uniref:hypothetical protein n=1 Tax=Allopontixanthobacter sp. TaxID=2906452 RepID=UPI002AB893DD|nr:hypothetical protein [Allopontixanthobacter sp.]MDZ4307342.1 hypothetical protein [Allopontixanthobacter sp.]
MIVLVQAVLGFVTFLTIYFWIFSYFYFHSRIERLVWRGKLSEKRVQPIAFSLTVAGGIVIWLLWRFVLPDWWIEATPMIVAD